MTMLQESAVVRLTGAPALLSAGVFKPLAAVFAAMKAAPGLKVHDMPQLQNLVNTMAKLDAGHLMSMRKTVLAAAGGILERK